MLSDCTTSHQFCPKWDAKIWLQEQNQYHPLADPEKLLALTNSLQHKLYFSASY